MPTYKTPGVYIEERPATGPIAGVGTSTAAFLGPALAGPINVPTKITNWTRFKTAFGGYVVAPRHYLAHAVRGFFANGGTVAYIVRVGTAKRAWAELADRATPAGTALKVEAKEEGTAGNSIKVEVQTAQIVDASQSARARRAGAAIQSAQNDTIELQTTADAALFKPGDTVTIESSSERVEIARIRLHKLTLTTNLTASYTTGHVRIADLVTGQRTFRVEKPTGLEAGSAVGVKQGSTGEDHVVERLNGEFVTLAGGGLTGGPYLLAQSDDPVALTTYEFNLVVSGPGGASETYSKLSMDPRHSRYFKRIVRSQLVEVTLPDVPGVATPPDNRPAEIATPGQSLAQGAADDLGAIGLNHYQAALAKLEKVDDVNLVCVPDRTDAGARAAVVAHCEKTADRFAILDSPYGAPLFGSGSIVGDRASVESKRGYAALYYPWIEINDPSSASGEDTLLVPPSGHLAGIYARSDNERGVHKAPANELIRGAVGLECVVDDSEQGELNLEGINVLRIFPGKRRPIVWGARTTTPKEETAWRYVNVRRLFLFVEESIQEGLRWAVFEPNGLTLWKKLDRTISEFLTRVWRSGALFGATADEAFYVKIDEELNPPSVRALGQLVIEIGIAPVRPAEFVIVRIGMWEGGAEVAES